MAGSREKYSGKTTNHSRRAGKSGLSVFKRITGGIAAIALILSCSFIFGSSFSSAHGNAQEDPANYKYYRSIEIQKGDSIWSIAQQYTSEEYNSITDYIDELITVNNLDSQNLDNIQEGDYLMIAYYDLQGK